MAGCPTPDSVRFAPPSLTAIEEAVTIRRALAEARPDAFRPYMGESLINLSGRLSELGRREVALTAIEEAVEVYRALAEALTDAFSPYLANSLNNLANRLAGLGGERRRWPRSRRR